MGRKRIGLGELAHARKVFNSGRRKCRLTFDQILECVERGDTLNSIAVAARVSRSRMRVIYELWFRKLLSLPDGASRNRTRQKEKRRIAREQLQQLPAIDVIQRVAREEGFKCVKPVPRDQRTRPGQTRIKELYIRGRLCGLHHLRNVRQQKGRKARYASTTLSRSTVERQDYKTFYIETEGCITRINLEREELLTLFRRPAQKSVTLYFPIDGSL